MKRACHACQFTFRELLTAFRVVACPFSSSIQTRPSMSFPKVIGCVDATALTDCTALPWKVRSRNAKDATMSKEAESAVFFTSMRTDGSSATTMLPAR